MRAVRIPPLPGRQAPSVVSGLPVAQSAEPARSKLGAMSGCVSSTPVSITATVTARLPSVFSWALSALMALMSHWSGSIGSAPGAASAASAFRCRAVSSSGVAVSVAASAGSGAVRVAPADSTPPALRMVFAKSGSGECATITPTLSYAMTTDPPAREMARSTAAGVP